MNSYKVLAAALSLSGLAGCATPPQPSRAEYLAQVSRTYAQPKEKVLAAAEEVLRLADGNDFQIAHNSDGFTAQRNWLVYIVIGASAGVDYWVVKTTEKDGRTQVETQVGTSMSTIAPMATTTPGTYSATTLPAGALVVTGPALYEVFFARMDYMLGLRADWPTCKWSDDRVSSKATYGNNEALCNVFNMADKTPAAPLVVAR